MYGPPCVKNELATCSPPACILKAISGRSATSASFLFVARFAPSLRSMAVSDTVPRCTCERAGGDSSLLLRSIKRMPVRTVHTAPNHIRIRPAGPDRPTLSGTGSLLVACVACQEAAQLKHRLPFQFPPTRSLPPTPRYCTMITAADTTAAAHLMPPQSSHQHSRYRAATTYHHFAHTFLGSTVRDRSRYCARYESAPICRHRSER